MIHSLEDDLDIPLFIRNSSSIELTEAGKIAYTHCKKLIADEDDLLDSIDAIKGLLTGTVKISAPNSMIISHVPEIIKRFSEKFPLISIFLDEHSIPYCLKELYSGIVDIVYVSEFKMKGFAFIPLFKDHARLIVNENHPLASMDTIPISELNGRELIMLPQSGQDMVEAVNAVESFSPVSRYYIHSDDAAISMVSAGLGIYIISDMQCVRLPENVVKKSFSEEVTKVKGIGIKSVKTASPAIKELVKISKEYARENGGLL